MRKYALLAVLMAFVVAFTSGCGLIVKDAEVDAQTVIIEVAGQSIVKADVRQAIENVLDYQAYMYSYYGVSFDRTDADAIASAQENAIDALIEKAVTDQKIREYGLDQFDDDELAAINKTVDDTYAGYVSTVTSYFFADTELTGEELNAAVEAKMLELGYGSKESMVEQEKADASIKKLRDMVVKDVSVTEDEIEAQYNTNVANAITAYASNLTQYASDVSGGAVIYFVPQGYRYVKNLLVKISDGDKAQLSSLSSEISDKQDTFDATRAALAELPEDPADDTGDQAKSREELTRQADTLSADIQSLTAQYDALTESAYLAIQPTVNDILVKIDAGEDFGALVAEYGEDTGMKSEPQKSEGYLVCNGLTTYVDEFISAAMALENVGDISKPFRSSSGIHIVQYASDLESGQVALADIHDRIKADLLAQKQDALYDGTVNQWVADANAKIYTKRLED
jgi:parvulin-like peptidyl-prolyl isomerase